MTANGVIVAHPGTQHSLQAALALQEAGLLQRYITGFYYKPESMLGRAVRLFPSNVRPKLEREFHRRFQVGLDCRRIRAIPAGELLYVATTHLKPFKEYARGVIKWRNEWFDGLVGRIVAQEGPGAVVCYDSCALMAFQMAKALGILCILDQSIGHIRAGLKLLREERELHPEFADSMPVSSESEWPVDRCSKEAALADVVLAPSEYVKESLIDHGVTPSRIAVLPFGADTERFGPSPRQDDTVFRLLFVGQLSQRKGIKYVLEAVRQLNLPKMELMLVGGIVGSGNGLRLYRDCFTHIPNVPHHEVHSFFQKADAFVYPSLHEGSAIAIYEALASGLPVVTTPNSGSVVTDGVDGFIVPIRDVEAIKEKIFLLYRDKELREEMGRKAREHAQEFTWAKYRQRFGALLRRLLGRPEGEEAECPIAG